MIGVVLLILNHNKWTIDMKPILLQKFREFLPIDEQTPLLTLGEGHTPLLKSSSIGSELGCEDLYFKIEGSNPTGSFKDRGMVLSVAKSLQKGKKNIVCASTGNTSASAAAYAAYCGLRATVLVSKKTVAKSKITQALVYGARVISLDCSFDKALEFVKDISQRYCVELVNSLNQYRIEGQKTAAFEIIEELRGPPDYLSIPVGNGGNITAYWLGFCDAKEQNWIQFRPKILGFQPEGAAPLVTGKVVEHPESVASALRIGNPARWKDALNVKEESGGTIQSVSDSEILEASRMLAINEGIFCEPASAACVAGLIKLVGRGLDLRSKKVVCVITGNGLKDPDSLIGVSSRDIEEVSPRLDDLDEILDLL